VGSAPMRQASQRRVIASGFMRIVHGPLVTPVASQTSSPPVPPLPPEPPAPPPPLELDDDATETVELAVAPTTPIGSFEHAANPIATREEATTKKEAILTASFQIPLSHSIRGSRGAELRS